jgi:hypothetical protein
MPPGKYKRNELMKNRFLNLPEGMDKRARNAYRVATILLAILVVFDIFSTIN